MKLAVLLCLHVDPADKLDSLSKISSLFLMCKHPDGDDGTTVFPNSTCQHFHSQNPNTRNSVRNFLPRTKWKHKESKENETNFVAVEILSHSWKKKIKQI